MNDAAAFRCLRREFDTTWPRILTENSAACHCLATAQQAQTHRRQPGTMTMYKGLLCYVNHHVYAKLFYLVNVKWGKNKYNVEVNTAEPPLVFKSQLFALTGVLPERQKSMLISIYITHTSTYIHILIIHHI